MLWVDNVECFCCEKIQEDAFQLTTQQEFGIIDYWIRTFYSVQIFCLEEGPSQLQLQVCKQSFTPYTNSFTCSNWHRSSFQNHTPSSPQDLYLDLRSLRKIYSTYCRYFQCLKIRKLQDSMISEHFTCTDQLSSIFTQIYSKVEWIFHVSQMHSHHHCPQIAHPWSHPLGPCTG